MPASEILKDLKEKKIHPIYFLQGEEPFYIDKVCDYIEENVLPEAEKSFNQTVLYGRDSKMSDILANARRFPMMAEKQVVIVKEAHLLEDFKNKESRDMLQAYIENPLDSTVLLFCHKYGNLDGRTPLAKAIKEKCVLMNSAKLKDYQLPKWINSYLNGKNYKITELATQMLADHIGNNLERLSNEIDKLLIKLNNDVVIDENLIEKNIGISKEYNVFELQNALLKRDVLKANRIVKYFGANPKDHHPIPIIALLYSLFNKLLLTHHSNDKSQSNLARLLKIPPYFVKDYTEGMRNYPLYKVLENIKHIHEADLTVKGIDSPPVDSEGILKQLVFKLVH